MPKERTKDVVHDAKLEKRVEALEQEVRELRQLLMAHSGTGKAGPDDWKKTIGMFKDDPLFDEVLKLGRSQL